MENQDAEEENVRREVEYLFDLSTVIDPEDDGEMGLSTASEPKRLRKTIVTVNKAVLNESGVTFQPEKYIRYDEVKETDPELKMNIMKSCNTADRLDGNYPCMPSLRLDLLDREYHEPIRDRDKDWAIDSQRHVVNAKGKDLIAPVFDLPLGQYPHEESISKLFWAKEYQTLLRERRLGRHAAIISDTNCIVQVYGLGFNGRMFSEGSNSPKLLIVEAYSIWNCTTYTIVLTVLELKLLFSEKLDLLNPGRRQDLVAALVGSLYFNYEIDIPQARIHLHYQHGDGTKSPSALSAAGDANFSRPASAGGVRTPGEDEENEENESEPKVLEEPVTHEEIVAAAEAYDGSQAFIQTVKHLDPPIMPFGFPKTVEEMIRFPPVRPEDSTAPQPIVTQELKIATSLQENGPKMRKRLAGERRLREEAEERRKYEEWLATHKRKRDLVGIRVLRRVNYFVTVMAYFEPLRPGTIIIRSLLHQEATRIVQYLGLGRVQDMLQVKTPAHNWSASELKEYVQETLLGHTALVETAYGGIIVSIEDGPGVEVAPVRRRHVGHLVAEYKKRKLRTASPASMNDMNLIHPFDTLLRADVALPVPTSTVPPMVSSSARRNTSRSLQMLASGDTASTRPTTAASDAALEGAVAAAAEASLKRVVSPKSAKMSRYMNKYLAPTVVTHLGDPATARGWTSLSHVGGTRFIGRTLGCTTRPARDLFKPFHPPPNCSNIGDATVNPFLRLTSRAMRVPGGGHVYCVYTLLALIPHNASATGARNARVDVLPSPQQEKAQEQTQEQQSQNDTTATTMMQPLDDKRNHREEYSEAADVKERGEPSSSSSPSNRERGGGGGGGGTFQHRQESRIRERSLGYKGPIPTWPVFEHPNADADAKGKAAAAAAAAAAPSLDNTPDQGGAVAIAVEVSAAAAAAAAGDATTTTSSKEPHPASAAVANKSAEGEQHGVEEEEEEEEDADEDGDKHDSDMNSEENESDSSDEDDDQAGGGEEDSSFMPDDALNEADAKNDAYITTADGFELELEINFPYASEYEGIPIPSGTHRIRFVKADLDKIVPADKREDLAKAFAALYARFYEQATAEEATQAESMWDYTGRELIRQCRWERQPVELPPAVLAELQRARQEEAARAAAALEEARAAAAKAAIDLNAPVDLDDDMDSVDFAADDVSFGTKNASREEEATTTAPAAAAAVVPDTQTNADQINPEELSATVGEDGEGLGGEETGKREGNEAVGGDAEAGEGEGEIEKKKNQFDESDVQCRILNAEDRFAYAHLLLYTQLDINPPLPPVDLSLCVTERGDTTSGLPFSPLLPVNSTNTNARLLLVWSNIIYSRAIRVRSTVLTRGETVLLQAHVWQRGEELGVVCFDREKNDVYFTQHPDSALQASQVRGYRFITAEERRTEMFIFLTSFLAYTEFEDHNGEKHGRITFGAVEMEEAPEAAIELEDVVDEDYAAATAALLDTATNKANERMKRK